MTDDRTLMMESDGVPGEVRLRRSSVARELALGFGYWLLFLMILQPGMVFQAAKADVPLHFSQEFLRIGGASLLGAAVTPLFLELTRRFPVEGSRRWRHALIHAINLIGLSLILIIVAQVLAGWVLTGRDPRLQAPLDRQIITDAPLLIFCMATFVAGAHALLFWRRAEQQSLLLIEIGSKCCRPPTLRYQRITSRQ